MGGLPELAIFRRFKNAAALDLLYQQASLQRSVEKWKMSVELDMAHTTRREFDHSFVLLQDSVIPDSANSSTSTNGSTNGAQWREWCELSEKLDRYCEPAPCYSACSHGHPTDQVADDKLLRFRQICSLAPVDKIQLSELRRFLSNEGNSFFEGIEEQLYESLHEADLVSIAHTDKPDWFTKLARGRASFLFHIFTRRNKSGRTLRVPRLAGDGERVFKLVEYSDESVQKLSRTLYALLTSAMVTIAVFTLNKVKSFGARIGLILLHNLCFTMGMAFLTHVKPVELFAAAAAYAAVLVVFASGSFGLTGSAAT